MRQFELTPSPQEQAASQESVASILDGLNERQVEAVTASDGPLLVVAGPGSGKTRVLTCRVAHLLATGKARPYQVLALTFTNKAAREMKARIEKLVSPEMSRGIWMGTFHSIFARILRIEAEHLGYTSDFSIYDTDDQERVLRGLMSDHGVDSKQFSVRSIRNAISGAKTQMLTPTEYGRVANTLPMETAARVFGPYEQALRAANALDFDDLLLKPIQLFKQSEETLEKYRAKWRYVHIDEYQDTNRAQYLLARQLSGAHQNLCVVGDDAQSIYAFRGADIGNILSFQQDFPKARTVRLEQNYRSTKKVLRLADSVISHNKDQIEKTLWTENADGYDVILLEALSEKDEAQKLERRIRDLNVRAGFPYRDFAVLYRTNSQSRAIEDALRRGSIPYQVVGGVSFYARREIKDVLAYLRLVVNPLDLASLKRVINYPRRGIGDASLAKVQQYAADNGITLWEALRRVEQVSVPTRARNSMQRFVALVDGYRSLLQEMPADELAREVIRTSGVLDEFKKEHTLENQMRWENVQELVSGIAEFAESNPDAPTLSAFLQEVTLYTDADRQQDGNYVTLMTLHASKGLEYPVVFISGMEEGLFPLGSGGGEPDDLDEERRLFYVGVTRAEKRLFLSTARTRYRFGEQHACIRSRFIDEADASVIQNEAGGRYQAQGERFTRRNTDFASYKDLDPDYYRVALTGPGRAGGAQGSRRAPSSSGAIGSGRRKAAAAGGDGAQRIVYEEGVATIEPGVQVEHPMFGEGRVLAIEGTGSLARATVDFAGVGQKKLVLRFARLKVVG